MVVDVAMKHPQTRGVRNHVDRFRSHRQQTDRVPASAAGEHRVAVPMRSVEPDHIAYIDHQSDNEQIKSMSWSPTSN